MDSQNRRNFDSARVLYVICTRVTWKMHSFLGNSKRIKFFLYIIREVILRSKDEWYSETKDCFQRIRHIEYIFVTYKRLFSNYTAKNAVDG